MIFEHFFVSQKQFSSNFPKSIFDTVSRDSDLFFFGFSNSFRTNTTRNGKVCSCRSSKHNSTADGPRTVCGTRKYRIGNARVYNQCSDIPFLISLFFSCGSHFCSERWLLHKRQINTDSFRGFKFFLCLQNLMTVFKFSKKKYLWPIVLPLCVYVRAWNFVLKCILPSIPRDEFMPSLSFLSIMTIVLCWCCIVVCSIGKINFSVTYFCNLFSQLLGSEVANLIFCQAIFRALLEARSHVTGFKECCGLCWCWQCCPSHAACFF
jgi:hypothetical protein